MLDLDKRSITYLPGVGPKKADILQKEAGISSYEDLLFYFPYKYIDKRVNIINKKRKKENATTRVLFINEIIKFTK